MVSLQVNASPKRVNPFSRHSASPSPGPQPAPSRPKSAVFASVGNTTEPKGHTRNSSHSHFSAVNHNSSTGAGRERSSSTRHNSNASGTFAPQFIKSEELRRVADQFQGIEGENDFSGKRYVWLKDIEKAFVRGLVIEEKSNGELLVQCDDGSV
jgi:myosin heavy chain 9/10/11/14